MNLYVHFLKRLFGVVLVHILYVRIRTHYKHLTKFQVYIMFLRFCFTESNCLYYGFVFGSTVTLFYALAFNTLHSNLQQIVNHRCCGKFRL